MNRITVFVIQRNGPLKINGWQRAAASATAVAVKQKNNNKENTKQF